MAQTDTWQMSACTFLNIEYNIGFRKRNTNNVQKLEFSVCIHTLKYVYILVERYALCKDVYIPGTYKDQAQTGCVQVSPPGGLVGSGGWGEHVLSDGQFMCIYLCIYYIIVYI